MKKKRLEKGAVVALSACMLVNSLPVSSLMLNVFASGSVVDFTNEENRGGWDKTSGDGTISFTNGIGESGFMSLDANNSNTVFAENKTEKRSDGFVEMDITSKNTSRFAIVFRYNSPSDWEGIGVDNGNWLWFNGAGGYGNLETDTKSYTSAGEKHRIRVEYENDQIRVLQDNKVIIEQTVKNFGNKPAGNLGVRMWGDCKIDVDNVKDGALKQPYEFVDFTDETRRGNWGLTLGKGNIAFTDGVNEEGFMTLTSDDNTIFADTATSKRKDGYVEMDITLKKNARFAIAFRYNSPTDWEGIGVDSGNWTWFNGKGNWGNVTSTKKTFTNAEEKHRIRVEYRGNHVRVLEDGVEIINQKIEGFTSKEGHVGMRLWGKASDGGADFSCQIKVDNVKTGDLIKELTINPESLSLSEIDAGKKDYSITLSGHVPTLKEIKQGTKVLQKDVDYTVNESMITLKKEYLSSIKTQLFTSLEIIFDDGQTKTFPITMLKKDEDVTYQRNFKDGIDGMNKMVGSGSMTHKDNAVVFKGDGVFIDENSKELRNQEVEFTYDPLNNNCNYGVVLRYSSPTDYLYVGPYEQSNQHYTIWGIYGPNGKIAEIQDSGFILANRNVPYKVKVRVIDQTVTIFVDNEEIYNGVVDITNKPGKMGFKSTSSTQFQVQQFQQNTAYAPTIVSNVETQTITSDKMSVTMDKNFPRVVEYQMNGVTLKGQEIANHQVELNNRLYTPRVTTETINNGMIYHLNVEELGIQFDTVFTVENNVLEMKIKNVQEKDVKLYTINFPEHSLISMSSTEENAELRSNNYKGETRLTLAKEKSKNYYEETTLAVLSNANIAAAVSGSSYKNRHEVAYQTFDVGTHTSTGIWMNEYSYRGLDGKLIQHRDKDGKVSHVPWVRVALAQDKNNDNKVDYQDAAIVLRDDCMPVKVGADTTTKNWNMIAMNVGSEAQYPFLRILDNAKKMSLATDDFGQNIIIKGYQSEGHDASHPDFANYNKRAGGLEDFNTLLNQSEALNAKIGIHVNHTDVYPEAPQYDALATPLGAWSWYDSASQIVRENDSLDQSEAGLDARFAQLYDKDTKNQIDTTYVDVFFGTRWPMYKLIENINFKDRNMALGTEYVDEMVSFSTFAHHIGSNFGGAGNLVRFVSNDQADIFANHNLFRGAGSRANDDVGIDGWQSAKNMNNALDAFYQRILPNKFLAQYSIMQYETDNKAVLGEKGEVVTEMIDGVNVISKDGKKVAVGNQIFIPWEDGGIAEGKIYHYNEKGGTTTWSLPNSWGNIGEVTLYELSDQGKSNPVKLAVNNGEVEISAKAKTGYVLYKKEATKIKTASNIEWSTGSPVKDMGFDSHNFDEWNPSSSATTVEHITIENNNLGNSHLFIKGKQDGKVTQTLTGLIPGQVYAASVWCITDEGRKASITVENGKETVTNYMTESDVTYGIHHNDKYKTKAQRMQVRFTATSSTATLSLSAEQGNRDASIVDFDDVRVVKVGKDTNPNPEKYRYWEDFENTDQGYGAFVSTESDQSHLSQVNPTNPSLTPDVIEGTYSLKVRAGDYMRTLPSTVRLLPDTEYTVGIKHKSPGNDAFTFAVKSTKAKNAGDEKNAVIASKVAANKEGDLVLKFVTGSYDDYYVDITKKNATEYYIDNFYVQEARPINRETLTQLVKEASEVDQKAYTPESYQEMMEAVKEANLVLDKEDASMQEIRSVYKALETKMESLIAYANKEDKEKLQAMILEMRSILTSDYHGDAQWLAFQSKIKEAEKLIHDETLTLPQMMELIQELQDSKNELNPVVDRSELRSIMKKAEKVDRNSVVDGKELQTFLSAMENAKTMDLKPGVSEEEIKAVTQTLIDAYAAIELKPTIKNELISDTLAKTEVKQDYFLEKDWAMIQKIKAQLQAMRTQEHVMIQEYYEAVEKLNEALGNKLAHPVIPTSIAISSKNFGVTANTEYPGTGAEGPITLAFDNKQDTIWHSDYSQPAFVVSEENPAIVEIDMKDTYTINQFSYLPRQSGENGNIQKYNLYVKANDSAKSEWIKVVDKGTFEKDSSLKKVSFDEIDARYVKLEVLQGIGEFAAAAEFTVYQKASDFAGLQQIMSTVEKLDLSLYTKASAMMVQQYYSSAEEVLKNPLTDQNILNSLTAELEKAVKELVLLASQEDQTILENTLASAKELQLENYKDTKAFEDAIKAVEALLKRIEDGEEVTKEEATRIALQLAKEQERLELIQPMVNKDLLEAEIRKAIPDTQESIYTKETWNVYQNALALARNVFANEQATQQEIDNALLVLQAAKEGLKKAEDTSTVDKTSLEALINQALDANVAAIYTKDSWKAYQIALQQAKAVLANASATQEEVDAAVKKLTLAYRNLVLANLEQEKPNQPQNPVKPNDSNGSLQEDTNTGDQSQAGLWATTLALTAAALAFLGRKRRNNGFLK